MQIANCNLLIRKDGSTVPKKHITPAEVQVLIFVHQDAVGKFPILDLQIQPGEAMMLDDNMSPTEEKRSSAFERNRLEVLYRPFSDLPGQPKLRPVDKLWPSPTQPLPEKFSEVIGKNGEKVFLDDGKLKPQAVIDPELVTLGGKTYTKAQLEAAVATKPVAPVKPRIPVED